MVKHNNSIPNAHFKKNWQKFVKTWFDQPSKKENRKLNRIKKINNKLKKRIQLEEYRPVVHCPTKIHNIKIKIGKGFSMEELSEIGLAKNKALSLGVIIDKRRRSKNLGKKLNIIRLQNLIKNIEILKKKKKFDTKKNFIDYLEEKDKNSQLFFNYVQPNNHRNYVCQFEKFKNFS